MRRSSPGFSLIEAAIVLGIVGLVIGGIWVAATSVRTQYRISTTLEAITLGVQTARKYSKTIGNTDTLLGPVLGGKPLPGGYTYNTSGYGVNSYTRGNEMLHLVMMRTSFASNNVNYFLMQYFPKNQNGTLLIDPPMCIAISTKLLNLDFGTPPAGTGWGSLNWVDISVTPIFTWSKGMTKPTLADISTFCETTTSILTYTAL